MNQTHPSIEQIVDYLHGELSPAEDAAIHAHFAACRDCAEQRAEEVAITETLRTHARAAERDLPVAVIAGIRQRVARSSRPSFGERLRAVLRPIVVFPAAAALAALLYVGIDAWYVRSTTPTTIDAASYVENHSAMAATAPFGEDTPMLTSDNAAR